MNSPDIKPAIQFFTVESQIQLLTLKQKSLPVSLPLTFKDTIEKMVEAVKKEDGLGLAAPQIGVNERIIVCNFNDDLNNLEIIINPTYVNNGNIKEDDWEGCFSIPLTFAKVPRWRDIDVSYYTVDGDLISKKLSGLPARIYQHECDHLDGILMTEQASESKTFSTEKEFKAFIEEVIRKEREAAAMQKKSSTSLKYTP